MNYPAVYALSKRFAPPQIDLRQAQIMDDYGDESWAKLLVNHTLPEDVSHNELVYYPHVWGFMGFEDLLFYLYAIATHQSLDHGGEYLDHYLYSLDRFIHEKWSGISQPERAAIIEGLQWIKNGSPEADWEGCLNLHALLFQ